MFADVHPGETVLLRFEGSTLGLAMRATYQGRNGDAHDLTGIGVMSDARFAARPDECGTWRLSSGRVLHSVERA